MEQALKSHSMEVAKSLILKIFKFLEDQYFYIPTYRVEDDATFLEYLNVEYINEVRCRKIRIGYTKAQVYNEVKYTFSCSIIRMPYSDVEDYFSLSNYLQSQGKDFSTSLINTFNESHAEKILIQIAFTLKQNALEIMRGNDWLKSYYTRKD